MSRRLLVTSVLGTLLICCSKRTQPDGGPCSYNTINYPATILEIFALDSVTSDLMVAVDLNGQIDTLSFSSESHSYINSKYLKSLKLKMGDTITYEHRQITSGSCNPDVFFLKIDRYKK